jgi:hypothetical protein
MANYSRLDGIKKKHPEPAPEVRARVEHDLMISFPEKVPARLKHAVQVA